MRSVTLFLCGSLALYAGPIGVDVCVNNGGMDTLSLAAAKLIASRILRQANVELVWSPKCTSHAIEIELRQEAPSGYRRGAVAFAQPFEGRTIQVFLNRVHDLSNPSRQLGFIMAHEITHILQASNRHASEGIMKAHWEPKDLRGMLNGQLRLTPRDVDLIHEGLTLRQNRIAMESRILLTAEAK